MKQKLSEEEAYKLSMKIEPRDPSEAIEMMLLKEDQLRQTIRELEVFPFSPSFFSSLSDKNIFQIKVTQLENENDRLRSLQDSTSSSFSFLIILLSFLSIVSLSFTIP